MAFEIVVFLPTYNERDNLPVLVRRLFGLGRDLFVLVVDDHSPDGTGAVAEALAEEFAGRLRVIHREGPRGRGTAGIVGLAEAARMDCCLVVEMDADCSHDPDDLPRLLEAAETADLVIGSRYVAGGEAEGFGLLRTLNSRVARGLTVWILGLHYADPTSGYRVYRKEILARLPWDRMVSDGPSIVEETLYYIQRNGATVTEVPITYRERKIGRSKITPGIIIQWIRNLLRIRRMARQAV
ncbi:MAG: polyprenol monophosphomannose synthase [bacterium]|jgi:dolichol-phosphate mannosyltransferase|nr:polyprenol monophosphomannose synthase [bacterium]